MCDRMKAKQKDDNAFDVLLDVAGGVSATTPVIDPFFYQQYKNLEERKIYINYAVDDSFTEMVILPFMQMDKDGEPIEIILDTPGGDIFKGFNLIDLIEKAKSPVTIHILSMAASMGLLIAMAGKANPEVKTVCHPMSIGLLHSGESSFAGASHAVKDAYEFFDRYLEKVKQYIFTHSKVSEELYAKIERKEYWMDAEEMVELGIVDEII